MRAGRLDRRITIQRSTPAQDAAGQEVDTWAALDHRRPASVKPLKGDERFTSDQYVARQQVAIEIRYAAVLADLNPLDRIVYPPPATANEQSPPVETVFEIMDVQELGRRVGLKIMAARRSEQ